MENITQESTVVEDVPNFTCASEFVADYDMVVACDHFDNGTFEEEDERGAGEDDDVSLGSEDNEYDSSDDEDDDEGTGEEEPEGNARAPQAEQENDDGDGSSPSHEEISGDEECRDGAMSRAVNNAEARFSYTAEELRMMKLAHVEVPAVSNDKDLSRIHRVICDSYVFESESVIDSDSPEIRKGMKFNSLPELQFFLADYAVRHHRPFNVVHSDKSVRYDVLCKQGCLWGVWARIVRGTGQWKITKVRQPHTCASSRPKQVHAQCMARYLAHHILGIVRKDSDTSVPSLMESIFGMCSYRVKYSKAWRAKQHAIALCWGDWLESYARVPRVLTGMSLYNPGITWFVHTGNMMLPHNGVYKHVLQRVFWCFPQCAESFQHCRPVILVDATFLTGKYKGTLMMAVAVDPERQLVPLAFALTEGENNDSWSWYMKLVRQYVLGPSR